MSGLFLQTQQALFATLTAAHDPKDHVVAHPLVPITPDWNLPMLGSPIEGFYFTNHLLMLLVAAGLTMLIFIMVGKRYQAQMAGIPIEQSVPRGFASLVEGLMDALRLSVVKPVLGENTDRFMPFLWTTFFFILICNLLGMIPLDPTLQMLSGGAIKHIGGTATGNINITAGMALCAFFMIHFSGVREVFEALIAGTYGHHHHEDEHGDDHGLVSEAYAEGMVPEEQHPQTKPASPAFAFVAAPIIYLYNFAPHPFAVEGRTKTPPVALRPVMIVIFGALLTLEMFGLAKLILPGTENYVMWFGTFLGIVFALNCGGLHPLDFGDALMWGFLFPLEVIGALVKPFALCMRLFANMVAGHMVLAALLLIPVYKGLSAMFLTTSGIVVIGCTLFSCLELFVAFLQAYIFMFLTTMFINAAVAPEH